MQIEKQKFITGMDVMAFTELLKSQIDQGWLAYPSTLVVNPGFCYCLLRHYAESPTLSDQRQGSRRERPPASKIFNPVRDE